MAKYNYEYKKKIVEEYLAGEISYRDLAKKYGIKAKVNIQQWVRAYQTFGNEGLMRSKESKRYTFEFKLSVVELYLKTEVSYQELALKMGMNNPPLIARWVNDYRIAGPDALRDKCKGRRLEMPKNKDSIDKNEKYLKQLEEENLKLKIENAYLKELRRLRPEKEAQSKK